MISEIDHTDRDVAKQIHDVFQRAYGVEAELIGAADLPPLRRGLEDIARADTHFYGFFEQDSLAAVIEFGIVDACLDICSLTVAPDFFRRGIGDKLLNFVLTSFDVAKAVVETAAENYPAIRLYEKHGFVADKRWTPEHGIEKVGLTALLSTESVNKCR